MSVESFIRSAKLSECYFKVGLDQLLSLKEFALNNPDITLAMWAERHIREIQKEHLKDDLSD